MWTIWTCLRAWNKHTSFFLWDTHSSSFSVSGHLCSLVNKNMFGTAGRWAAERKEQIVDVSTFWSGLHRGVEARVNNPFYFTPWIYMVIRNLLRLRHSVEMSGTERSDNPGGCVSVKLHISRLIGFFKKCRVIDQCSWESKYRTQNDDIWLDEAGGI